MSASTPCLQQVDFERLEGGLLELSERTRLHEHLAECDQCRRAYENFRRDEAFLSVMRGAIEETTRSTADPAKPESCFPQIEGYRLTGILGQGGMGVVYQAVQVNLNRLVALKLLPAAIGATNPDAVARFRREASAAARLHHRNIVAIHDFGECRHAYYYTMEIVDGEPLSALIRRMKNDELRNAVEFCGPRGRSRQPGSGGAPSGASGSQSTPGGGARAYFHQIARWMADAADGLDYAHSQGVIHRDVKPANLLLAKDGRIMIADFGLAKAVGEESVTVTGSLLGTVRYLSPEQAMAKRLPIDQRTDVYSLGATMYELLCHRPAFPGDHEQEVLAAIITRDPIPPGRLRHDIPDDLEVICLKAMEKAAGDRYPTAGAMKEDLERYLEDRPIVARRPGPLRRAEKFLRRRRAAVAATVAVFAILLLIPAGALVLGERNERLQAWAAGRIDKSLYYSARQQWTEAEVCLGEVLGWDPGHPRALERLAVLKKDIYNSQGIKDPALLEQAYDLCERALIREPQSASAWNTKGVIAKKLGRTSEAIHAYEQAVRFGSNSPAVLDNLAVIYALARRLNEAERILGDATKPAEGQPCNFGALCNMAALQLFRGDPVVVQTLERTIKCDPDPDREFVPPCLLSRLYQSATGFRHEEEGLIQARMADALAKGRVPYTKRVLAIAELKNGKWEESLRNAGKALEAGDLAVINQLVRAAALSELGLMQEAERAYRAAQEVWPDELKSEDGYTVSAELGVIWIDTAAECRQLEQHYFAKIGRPDSSDFR